MRAFALFFGLMLAALASVAVLTYPAAVLPHTRDRPLFAERLRELARAIEEQLPGEAPQPAPEHPRQS